MRHLTRGRFIARSGAGPEDLARVQVLRQKAFRAGRQSDADVFDSVCQHVLIEEIATGRLVCCFRLLCLKGAQIDESYTAQFYELTSLSGFQGAMAEMGRFCIDPEQALDPDILRMAWAALTQIVEAERVEMLFGCTSFHGIETGDYHDAFALLRDRHLAPLRWRPGPKAQAVFEFAKKLRRKPDLKRAMAKMPPLLRSYLAMGGWVSDHAVIDADLGTLHVFTGLEIKAIPPARARALRAMAG